MQTVYNWMQTQQIKFGAAGGAKSANSAAARGIAYHKRLYKVLALNFLMQPGLTFQAEPWFRTVGAPKQTFRSPDGLALRCVGEHVLEALVIEVKLNWKDGRDVKLLDEYVPIVSNVFDVKAKPLLITRNVRGLAQQPMVGLSQMLQALTWQPGDPTPVALVVA